MTDIGNISSLPSTSNPNSYPPLDYSIIHRVIATACRQFCIHPGAFLGDTRKISFVRARYIAMYVARELSGRSSMVIGRAFRRDHTTVLNGYRWVELRLKSNKDPLLKKHIDELRAGVLAS